MRARALTALAMVAAVPVLFIAATAAPASALARSASPARRVEVSSKNPARLE